MKKTLTTILSILLLTACGGSAAHSAKTAVAPQPVKHYTYTVQAVYPHLPTSYTQGLQFTEGTLWEGTGQNGESVLQKLDLETGKATVLTRLPREEFGEGITVLGEQIFQLTWQSNTAHVYDAATGQKLREHRYPGEGWGLTTDGQKLYMSDGSANIYTVDPATFKREKSTTVTFEGRPVQLLNELEWVKGKIWANIYTTDQIAIINPATGVVEGVIDLSELLAEADRTPRTDVLNGIAYDAAGDRIFVTGKNWNKLFQIDIIEK